MLCGSLENYHCGSKSKMVHYTRGHGILFIIGPSAAFLCPFTGANVGTKAPRQVLAIGEVSNLCIECQKQRSSHLKDGAIHFFRLLALEEHSLGYVQRFSFQIALNIVNQSSLLTALSPVSL